MYPQIPFGHLLQRRSTALQMLAYLMTALPTQGWVHGGDRRTASFIWGPVQQLEGNARWQDSVS